MIILIIIMIMIMINWSGTTCALQCRCTSTHTGTPLTIAEERRSSRWLHVLYTDDAGIPYKCDRTWISITKVSQSQYSGVTLNAGGAISPSTGVFTCPVPGTYLFIGEISSFHISYSYNDVLDTETGELFSWLWSQCNGQARALKSRALQETILEEDLIRWTLLIFSKPGDAQREEGTDQLAETETWFRSPRRGRNHSSA